MRRVLLVPFADPNSADTERRDVELVEVFGDDVAAAIGVGVSGWEVLDLDVERLVLIRNPATRGDGAGRPRQDAPSLPAGGLEGRALMETADSARADRDL